MNYFTPELIARLNSSDDEIVNAALKTLPPNGPRAGDCDGPRGSSVATVTQPARPDRNGRRRNSY